MPLTSQQQGVGTDDSSQAKTCPEFLYCLIFKVEEQF